ncbi:MAG: substrate-binding domain-containing protein [Prevotella sp.]|nr:substrate-binding domain-containing protein [Prevotella sp.]
MNRTRFNKIVGLSLFLGLFLACGNKPKTDLGYDYEAAASFFAADESFHPILDEELEVFTRVFNRNAVHQDTLKALYTSEQEAIEMLMKNETWLAFTTRSLTEKELSNLKARSFAPRIMPIGYDGLAIIVNNVNTDTCITVKDIARILKGEVTSWSDIYPKSKLGKIEVVFDNPRSSAVRYCVDSILGGQPINSDMQENIGAMLKSAEVVDYVERTPNAFGIIGSNWLNDQRDTTNVTFKKNITVMKVSRLDSATVQNSRRPYQYYIYNGSYPLVRTIYAIINEPRTGQPTGFANFCRLPQGQRVIFNAGLLPIMRDLNVRQVNVVK